MPDRGLRSGRNRAREVLNSTTEFVNDPYEAARDADALLILTEWEEFARLDLDRVHKQLKYPIVIDGRNLYDPDAMAARGFTYYSVGRLAATPVIPESAIAAPARKLKKS
jgi:UDPglucose 6-dehydrogenase